MPDVVMPRLSDSMEEGTVLKWLKAPGEEVRRGEELVEIETDKATMTYESDQDGVLEIVAAEGDTLPIGAIIARVGSPQIGSPPTAGAAGNGAAGAAVAAPATGEATSASAPVPVPVPDAPVPAPAAGGGAAPATAAPRGAPSAGARLKASPVARRIARELGVDLAGLAGSGPGGRIVRSDVEGAAGQGAAPATAPSPSGAPAVAAAPTIGTPDIGTAKGEVTLQELTRTQQVVARRMAESRATIPDFTLQAEVDMGACVEMRAALKALDAGVGGVGGPSSLPTYNDMVVKACAIALRENPRANGSYRDGRFELHSRVNVGVAVAAADSLVVPTVFDADTKSLLTVARDTRALAERVREGTVTPPELSGGTFTVSNLGMFGVRSFTAVINPPQAAILSVGSLEERPVVRDGRLVAGHTMSATLACDHRILYGADAARFLARIRQLLEQPLALTLTP
jgi:pyruvate dehydrogenase E2 component (dihydrolipoamide acetyltransferase)